MGSSVDMKNLKNNPGDDSAGEEDMSETNASMV